MKVLQIITFNICALTLVCHYAYANNIKYYVDDAFTNGNVWCTTNGNDAYDGLTPDKPKLTIGNLLSTYTLGSNDIVYVDTGTYNEWVYITSTHQGKSNAYIIFQGAGVSNQTSLVTGVVTCPNNNGCFTIENTKWIKITGFKCSSPGPKPEHGIHLYNASTHIMISNNIAALNPSTDINLYWNVSDSLILDNIIVNNSGYGITSQNSFNNLICLKY